MAWIYNAVAFADYLEGRYGTRVYRDDCRTTFPTETYYPIAFPGITGRNGLVGTKVGVYITAANGNFTDADVGNYWVWDDGQCEEIVDVDSATQIRVADAGEKTGDNCFIGGKHNGWYFHKVTRKVVVLLAHELWVADNINLSSWTRAQCVSYDQPSNAVSQFDEIDDKSVCFFNSNGLYKVWLASTIPTMYRVNVDGPNTYVTGIPSTGNLPYGRRYIISAAREDGEIIIRSRQTSGVLVELESSPNAQDDDLKDYAEIWTAYPRGNNTKTHGVLTGVAVAAASLDPVNIWAVVDNGTIGLTINDHNANLFVDFTGVQTMTEVAERIQTSMKQYWPDSTCEFNLGQFILTSGLVDGTYINAVAAGAGGTDITGAGYMNVLAGAIANDVIFARPLIVENLRVPVDETNPTIPQWHFTHIPIYVTLDIGVNGTDPVTGEGNDPERYIWAKDLRIAAAFLAAKNESGLVTASVGEFELADVGSVLEWDNGERDTITSYIGPTQVIVDAGGGSTSYGGEPNSGACAIGNGRVMRASQTGRTVVRTEGDFFTAADERKTIHWADGGRSYIVEYIDAKTVRVQNSATRASQGLTLDPTHRNFYDTIEDDSLRPRQKSYLIPHRAFRALPKTTTGKVVPGWVFCAIRGAQSLYYQQFTAQKKYLLGCHNPLQVNEDCKDTISQIEEAPNRVLVFCGSRVYGGPVNTSIQIAVPGTGEFINVFSGLQILDETTGVVDWGSICHLQTGFIYAITSEPKPRIFDGFKWGRNLAEDEQGRELVMDEIRSWQRATVAAFKDGELFNWGKR